MLCIYFTSELGQFGASRLIAHGFCVSSTAELPGPDMKLGERLCLDFCSLHIGANISLMLYYKCCPKKCVDLCVFFHPGVLVHAHIIPHPSQHRAGAEDLTSWCSAGCGHNPQLLRSLMGTRGGMVAQGMMLRPWAVFGVCYLWCPC